MQTAGKGEDARMMRAVVAPFGSYVQIVSDRT